MELSAESTTGWGGAGRLVPLIGQSRALELLLTARLIDAAEAQRIGLIHRILPAGEEPLAAAHAWAQELLALPQRALAANKALLHAAAHLPLPKTYATETKFFTGLWTDPDHAEALAAFGEKRNPEFNRHKD
jgi:enoyl-CoA hydratase/carnithine racemase